jgi:hypothetical protein
VARVEHGVVYYQAMDVLSNLFWFLVVIGLLLYNYQSRKEDREIIRDLSSKVKAKDATDYQSLMHKPIDQVVQEIQDDLIPVSELDEETFKKALDKMHEEETHGQG